jgi:hypothetical protein
MGKWWRPRGPDAETRPIKIAMWDVLESNPAVCVEPNGVTRAEAKPLALLPGSFNPLHPGHTTLAAVASARLRVPVHFELSVANVDKPGLPPEEIKKRVAQFATVGPVWVTRAATFIEKATIFPGAAFVLGWDTAIRLIDPAYYGGTAERDSALRMMLAAGCRFVVGGRVDEAGAFRVWDRDAIADEFADLFVVLAESEFRVDVSSRALRACAAEV